jgi:DNA-binding transcriptional MocR family regulator
MFSPIEIHKDTQKQKPLYRQIAEGIISQIESGTLPAGSRLPTVRELAEQLSVTRVTAHNAYNELRARGWIDATVGRGTFVIGPPSTPSDYSEVITSQTTPDKVMEDITRLSGLPGSRSLAMAEPDSSMYPIEEMARILSSLASTYKDLLHYGSSQGDLQLRNEISKLLAERHIVAKPDEILLTTGVTQGLSIVTTALCERGDKVLVEQPTYLGFLGLLQSCGVEPIAVPLDDKGLRLDYLERILLRERPRFLYTVPSFQNPTGICMSEERRSGLLSLAEEYGLFILEDDIYGYLDYDRVAPLPLRSRDPANLVVYVNSFSKVLYPGLRVGFIAPPAALRDRLLSHLRVRELCAPPLLQRALAEFIRRGLFTSHLERVLPVYRKRRDATLEALERFMPEDVRWTHPEGGYCVWVTLPEGVDRNHLYRSALSRGMAYTPGEVFLTGSESGGHLRLCFASREERVIRDAVSMLASIIKEPMSREAALRAPFTEAKPIV